MQPDERAESFYLSAIDAYERGDMKVVEYYATRLLESSQARDDRLAMARAHNFLGNCQMYRGNADGAERAYDAALDLYRGLGNNGGIVSAIIGKGAVHSDLLLDFAQGRLCYEEALRIGRASNQEFQIAFALANLGKICRLEGDYARALEYAQESLAMFERLDEAYAASQLVSIAHYRALRNEYGQAIATLGQAYEKLRKHQRMLDIANYFETWFFVAFELCHYEDAARLLGFLEYYRDERGVPRLPHLMLWFAPRLERLESRLGYDRLARLKREGELLSFTQANDLTRGITPPRTDRS